MKYPLFGTFVATLLMAGSSLADTSSTTTTTVTLTPQQQTEVREYVAKEHRPSVTVNDFDVSPGATLPPSVAFYSVPKVDRYQYTVVNEKRVLVDPTTRRIVEVYDESSMPQSGRSEEHQTTTTTERHD